MTKIFEITSPGGARTLLASEAKDVTDFCKRHFNRTQAEVELQGVHVIAQADIPEGVKVGGANGSLEQPVDLHLKQAHKDKPLPMAERVDDEHPQGLNEKGNDEVNTSANDRDPVITGTTTPPKEAGKGGHVNDPATTNRMLSDHKPAPEVIAKPAGSASSRTNPTPKGMPAKNHGKK